MNFISFYFVFFCCFSPNAMGELIKEGILFPFSTSVEVIELMIIRGSQVRDENICSALTNGHYLIDRIFLWIMLYNIVCESLKLSCWKYRKIKCSICKRMEQSITPRKYMHKDASNLALQNSSLLTHKKTQVLWMRLNSSCLWTLSLLSI